MGFLKNLKSAVGANIPESWIPLESLDQLKTIKASSFEKPAVIFKHSTSCGISNMAKFQLEGEWDLDADEIDFYYLDLWSYRPISNAVAEEFKIVHQSPQMIIIKDGAVVYHTSHHGVHLSGLKSVLKQVNA